MKSKNDKGVMPGDRKREIQVEAVKEYIHEFLVTDEFITEIMGMVSEGVRKKAERLVTPAAIGAALNRTVGELANRVFPNEPAVRAFELLAEAAAIEIVEREIKKFMGEAWLDHVLKAAIGMYFDPRSRYDPPAVVVAAMERAFLRAIDARFEITLRKEAGDGHQVDEGRSRQDRGLEEGQGGGQRQGEDAGPAPADA